MTEMCKLGLCPCDAAGGTPPTPNVSAYGYGLSDLGNIATTTNLVGPVCDHYVTDNNATVWGNMRVSMQNEYDGTAPTTNACSDAANWVSVNDWHGGEANVIDRAKAAMFGHYGVHDPTAPQTGCGGGSGWGTNPEGPDFNNWSHRIGYGAGGGARRPINSFGGTNWMWMARSFAFLYFSLANGNSLSGDHSYDEVEIELIGAKTLNGNYLSDWINPVYPFSGVGRGSSAEPTQTAWSSSQGGFSVGWGFAADESTAKSDIHAGSDTVLGTLSPAFGTNNDVGTTVTTTAAAAPCTTTQTESGGSEIIYFSFRPSTVCEFNVPAHFAWDGSLQQDRDFWYWYYASVPDMDTVASARVIFKNTGGTELAAFSI